MPFKLTWTGPTGSEQIQVATAAEALAEWTTRNRAVINMTIKDDHNRRVSPAALAVLAANAEGAANA